MTATFQHSSQSTPQSIAAPTDTPGHTPALNSFSSPQSSSSSPTSASQFSSAPDLFWHATPRAPSNGMAALMAAIQQLAPTTQGQISPVTFAKQLPRKIPSTVTARRPQCTHMAMTRMHGLHLCFMCGKLPSLGWVYICDQDQELEHRGLARQQQPVSITVQPEDPFNDNMSRFAESLKMSPTVVKGIRNGDYSADQVQRLIEQREHLISIIRDGESQTTRSTFNTPVKVSEEIIASAGARATPTHGPKLSLSSGTANNTPIHAVQNTPVRKSKSTKATQQACNYQVCHHCRPFFQDRLYMNLKSVIAGEYPALSEQEMSRLHVADAKILKKMDLRQYERHSLPQQVSDQSIDITSVSVVKNGEDKADNTTNWTHTSVEVGEADSQSKQYPCPGAGICPFYSPDTGCAYDHGFNDGLRTLNHIFGPEPDPSNLENSRITPQNSLSRLQQVKDGTLDTPVRSSSTASSISLPTPLVFTRASVANFHMAQDYDKVDEYSQSSPTGRTKLDLGSYGPDSLLPSTRQARERHLHLLELPIQTSYDTFRIMHPKTSNSSLGSEVEVDGGVALTEEAVQTGIPDIATDVK